MKNFFDHFGGLNIRFFDHNVNKAFDFLNRKGYFTG